MSRAVRAVIGLVCFIGIGGVCSGDGLVFVANHQGANIPVFDAVGTNLDPNTTYSLPTEYGYGMVDIEVDSIQGNMFVSWEGTSIISQVDVSDGTVFGNYNISPASDITGFAFDSKRFLLYATDRNTNKLHIIEIKEQPKLLETIELENIVYACGLAINENNDLLYVSEYQYSANPTYEKIKVYDIYNNFAFIDEIDMEEPIVGIAYDGQRNILYGTAYSQSYTPKLTKKKLTDESLVSKDIGYYGVGIAIDQDTGNVFVSNGNNYLELWDTSDWIDDPNQESIPSDSDNTNIYGAAGVGFINYETNEPNIPEGHIELGFTIDDSVNTEDPNEPNYVSCGASPNDELTYTITVDPNGYDHTDVYVTVYFPRELEYEYFNWDTLTSDPNFNLSAHTYTWYIPSLPNSGGPVNFTLPVKVTGQAEPGEIIRVSGVASDTYCHVRQTEETPICCWYTGNIFYVKKGSLKGNGTSWQTAFGNLTEAIDEINNNSCSSQITQIWVAKGTYNPGSGQSDTFAIPDNISVYGGFEGFETILYQRDYNKNKTILDGYIGENEFGEDRNDKVVTMGDESLLDGFTVSKGTLGIFANGKDFTVNNTIIKDNSQEGIRVLNSNASFNWCIVKNNHFDGIYDEGISNTPYLTNCKIYNNSRNGINCKYSIPIIKNSVIYHNGTTDVDYYGIYLDNPSSGTLIRNCTIAHNIKEGIKHIGSYSPDVRNCILAYNNDEQRQLGNCSVSYSCVYDPNDPNTPTNNNINCNPGFAYDYGEFGYYHLATNSNCIDTGDPGLSYTGEVDIDDESRVQGNYVDMGADEYNPSCSDVSNSKDLNGDGIVNLIDFAPLSASWLSYDPNNPPCNEPNCLDGRSPENFDIRCDYQLDGSIDVNDLNAFAIEWLWEACWRNTTQPAEMMTMYSTSELSTENTLEEQSLLAGLTDKELVDKAVSITNILDFIFKLADEKEIKKKNAQELTEQLADWLVDLQDEYYLRE